MIPMWLQNSVQMSLIAFGKCYHLCIKVVTSSKYLKSLSCYHVTTYSYKEGIYNRYYEKGVFFGRARGPAYRKMVVTW